jgi:hypothetical protein
MFEPTSVWYVSCFSRAELQAFWTQSVPDIVPTNFGCPTNRCNHANAESTEVDDVPPNRVVHYCIPVTPKYLLYWARYPTTIWKFLRSLHLRIINHLQRLHLVAEKLYFVMFRERVIVKHLTGLWATGAAEGL